MSTANHPEPPRSRLDREIEEILEQSSNRPVSFQDRVAQKRTAIQVQKQAQVGKVRSAGGGALGTAGRWAVRLPLVTALAIALLAVWVAPSLPIVAMLLGLTAAAFIFVPFAMWRPSEDIDYQKRWRGRTFPPPRSTTGVRGLFDAARDRRRR